MNAVSPNATAPAAARPVLAQTRVKEASLRRVSQLAAAVILVAAGVVVGMHLPELAAALITAGVQTGVGAMTDGHDERRHPRRRVLPEVALG